MTRNHKSVDISKNDQSINDEENSSCNNIVIVNRYVETESNDDNQAISKLVKNIDDILPKDSKIFMNLKKYVLSLRVNDALSENIQTKTSNLAKMLTDKTMHVTTLIYNNAKIVKDSFLIKKHIDENFKTLELDLCDCIRVMDRIDMILCIIEMLIKYGIVYFLI